MGENINFVFGRMFNQRIKYIWPYVYIFSWVKWDWFVRKSLLSNCENLMKFWKIIKIEISMGGRRGNETDPLNLRGFVIIIYVYQHQAINQPLIFLENINSIKRIGKHWTLNQTLCQNWLTFLFYVHLNISIKHVNFHVVYIQTFGVVKRKKIQYLNCLLVVKYL